MILHSARTVYYEFFHLSNLENESQLKLLACVSSTMTSDNMLLNVTIFSLISIILKWTKAVGGVQSDPTSK